MIVLGRTTDTASQVKTMLVLWRLLTFRIQESMRRNNESVLPHDLLSENEVCLLYNRNESHAMNRNQSP